MMVLENYSRDNRVNELFILSVHLLHYLYIRKERTIIVDGIGKLLPIKAYS